MKKIENLRKLYIHSLKDLYSAEKQLIRALPKMAQAATAPELKAAFEEHLEQTQEQVRRIEQIFQSLEYAPSGEKCAAMEGLIEEGEELMKEKDLEPEVLDVALIGAAQKVEHYEIAGYGTAREFARLLGEDEAVELLEMTLEEESETDQKLTDLARSGINESAMAGVGGGEDEEEEEE